MEMPEKEKLRFVDFPLWRAVFFVPSGDTNRTFSMSSCI